MVFASTAQGHQDVGIDRPASPGGDCRFLLLPESCASLYTGLVQIVWSTPNSSFATSESILAFTL